MSGSCAGPGPRGAKPGRALAIEQAANLEGMAGHVPTALVALTIDDALSIYDKLNRRLGYDREAWTAMAAASMHAEDDDPDNGAWH